MVECQHYPPLPMEISNEGIVNEEVGRDVEIFNNVVVRDEATSFEIGDKDAELSNLTLRIREINDLVCVLLLRVYYQSINQIKVN